MATAQLLLIPQSEWLLDETTKRIGRAGLAQARAALVNAHPAANTVHSIRPTTDQPRRSTRTAVQALPFAA